METKILALIPARGGSKSIPRKNVLLFAGHPLIAFSIAAGLDADSVNRVVVSTDNAEIAEVSRRYGAEAPFVRPAEFAQDDTLDFPVFQHALEWLAENENYNPQIVVQLRPTSPIRPKDIVDRAVRILLEHPEADSVRGVVPAEQNPYKMWRLDEKERMQSLLSLDGIAEPHNTPRQFLPSTYWQTGHIDVIRAETILRKHSMSGSVILPLMIDQRFSVDIDTLQDWQRAEWLISQGDLEIVTPRNLPDSSIA
ncbi:MAG: acylneuraminate cytidylyltransferase family protein [Chloroflexi bacterium]|nr:acylneuraminate cytidylyltransferase family protein [Chloroflexota bacterium]